MASVKMRFRYSAVPGLPGTLYYQVIHKRKVKFLSTGYRVFPDEWNAETLSLIIQPEGERRIDLLFIRASIERGLKQRKEIIRQKDASGIDYSLEELCDAFVDFEPCKTVFMFLSEQVRKKRQMDRQGTATTYSNAYKRFKEFRSGKDLPFEALTPDMMEHYEAWLVGRHLKQNTIRFYLRTLNTMFYKAVDEGLVADKQLFRRIKLSYVNTVKRAITERELKRINTLRLSSTSPQAFARDIFMFSFYMRGMPFVDIAFLKKSDLKSGVLGYCRRKTNQYLEIEWEPEQQRIVDRYAHLTTGSPYMFPIIVREDGTEYWQYLRMQAKVNRALKLIGRKVGLKIPFTTYVARHTWASVARNMDFPIAIISEGMGHRSYKTTQVYLDSIDSTRINDANRKIIQRISGTK